MKLKLIAAIAAITVLAGCSTEVELNAPYDSTTVVFGLLDAKQERQYIKINRTYLGEGNNLEYAQVRDSLEYDWDEFNEITVRDITGGDPNTYELDSITIDNKETDGLFYAPHQTVYYFDAGEPDSDGNYLNTDGVYELYVDFKNKEDVSAETTIINTGTDDFGTMFSQPCFEWRLVNFINGGVPTFNPNLQVQWNGAEDARRYEYSVRFHYIENVWADLDHTDHISSTHKTFDWKLGEVETATASGGEEFSRSLNPQSFYSVVANRLEADPYITREMGILGTCGQNDDQDALESMEFILTIGNEELNTYLNVNEPVTGIVQERPEYTNVNNGIGIFASRVNISEGPFPLSLPSRRWLATSNLTSPLNFCSPLPEDSEENFGDCPEY